MGRHKKGWFKRDESETAGAAAPGIAESTAIIPPIAAPFKPQQYYVKLQRQPLRCQECGALETREGAQAVICMSSGDDVAWFRCRACGARFCLPVRDADAIVEGAR